MSTDIATQLTREEYLAFERQAETKHEWIDGEIREMTGGSRAHSRLSAELIRLLGNAVRRTFEVHTADMRIRIPDGPYYYADASVAPSPPELEDDEADTLLNPLVIVEVLSPSTEAHDRGEKLDNYRRIPTLTDYVLVAQDRRHVDHYARTEDGAWRLSIFTEPAEVVRLPVIGCELRLSDVYERILED